jgi:hypothetical protein
MQIRLTMNMLARLQKHKVHSHSIIAESPLALHVKNYLFPPDQYAREEDRSHTLLRFKDKTTGKSFCLEVKTCKADWMNQIKWCTELQLRKYLSCHKKIPTFLLLDMENGDNKQHNYHLLSMTQACHAYLMDTSIMHWRIAANDPVSSEQLWSR